MTSRSYSALVVVWVAAAALAVGWSVRRTVSEGRVAAEALPPLEATEGVSASFETEDTLPSALQVVSMEPVEGGWTGPGGVAFYVATRSRHEGEYRHRQFGQAVFDLTLRLDESGITQEPCASCHEGQRPVAGRAGTDGESVHQNVQPVHPAQTGAQCLTCHAASDPGRLRLERGGTVSIDHAYRLCAQCHFRQVESWAHGAHGKRLVGWRGRRVVMGCADCHDPHRPATEVRSPLAGLSLPGRLRGESEAGEGGTHSEVEGSGVSHE
jgi:hypothetical protein